MLQWAEEAWTDLQGHDDAFKTICDLNAGMCQRMSARLLEVRELRGTTGFISAAFSHPPLKTAAHIEEHALNCPGRLESPSMLLLANSTLKICSRTLCKTSVEQAADRTPKTTQLVEKMVAHHSLAQQQKHLRDLLAIQPDFPAKAPGSKHRGLPVVLDKPDIIGPGINSQGLQAPQVQLLRASWVWLQYHLQSDCQLMSQLILNSTTSLRCVKSPAGSTIWTAKTPFPPDNGFTDICTWS